MAVPPKIYSLSELCDDIGIVVDENFQQTYWVCAEITSFAVRNHCYMDLVEKTNEGLVAKIRATCWKGKYDYLSAQFLEATGQPLQNGLKVLVEVEVRFHSVYGMGLNIVGINPAYTLGDWAIERQRTLQRLQADGVMEINKSIPIPSLIKRIAVISSEEAAGYEDFCHQLQNNTYKLPFHTDLYPATVQGENAVKSICEALLAVAERKEEYDLVVIIRGGGATTDLKCFDDYNVAFYCAQFPLPIVAGIGHTRDVSIVDMVVKCSVKTPTDAAQFIINHNAIQVERVQRAEELLNTLQTTCVTRWKNLLEQYDLRLTNSWKNYLLRQQTRLEKDIMLWRLCRQKYITSEKNRLNIITERLRILSPEAIYRKGYALVLHNGQAIRSAKEVVVGDQLNVELYEGSLTTQVLKSEWSELTDHS